MKQTLNLTKRQVAVALVLGMSTLATTQNADAQSLELRWGRGIAPRAGACFYRSPNFRGDYFCASPGDDIAMLSRGMDNQISSVRTFGDVEVTVFQEPRFRGRWARLEGDVRDLRREGWNDRLSSIRIHRGWGRPRGTYGDGRGNSYGDRGGARIRIETGEWRDDRPADRRDDRRDNSGYDRNDPRYNPNDRRDSGGGRNDANDRRDGRRENADVVVRRLYQEILQREPDAAGLSLYRDRMNNENWSEQDVREALLKSPEYRQRGSVNLTPQQRAEEIVARVYRSELGREPDPASRVYVDKILRERWSEADVIRTIRESPEYRNKHPF